MPDKVIVASIIEAALFVTGLVLLWRLFFSSTARARAALPWPLPYWDIPGYVFGLSVLRLLAVALAVQLMATGLLKKFAPELSPNEGLGLLVVGFSLQIGLLLGLGVSWLLLKGNRFQARLNAMGAPSSLPPPLSLSRIPAAGIATFLIMIAFISPVMLFWPSLLDTMGHPPQPQEVIELFTKADSPFQIALILFFAVVVAPVTEELLFRAGIFRYVRGRIPRIAAFILPALIFAAAHRSLTAGLPLFIFGLVQQVAYERTGRIAVPMIAHGLFNLHTSAFILWGVDPYTAAIDWLSK
jgi:membrane protease YdiL (CAAX protease family)